jgi:hypothetical protein
MKLAQGSDSGKSPQVEHFLLVVSPQPESYGESMWVRMAIRA